MPRSIERTAFLVSSCNGRHSDRWAFIIVAYVPSAFATLCFVRPSAGRTTVLHREQMACVVAANLGHRSSDVGPPSAIHGVMIDKQSVSASLLLTSGAHVCYYSACTG